MTQVEELLHDLDDRWTLDSGGPLTLRLLGSTALILQTDYARGTKDGDILETDEITPAVSGALLALAGKGTALARRHNMYVEILGAAFPFFPEVPLWHPLAPFDPPLIQFRVEVLDVLDVVIAKLPLAGGRPAASRTQLHLVQRDELLVEDSEIELPARVMDV